MIKTPYLLNALFITVLILGLSSCFGSKPVAYFNQGVIDTAKIQSINVPEQVIQKGDLLTITIYSDNPDATAIYNQAGGALPPSSNMSGVTKSVNPGQSGGASC
jgi:polysaccharide biosynthesis/export protein